jgi:hypothetical protein
MKGFVDYRCDTFGIEPICRLLQIIPSGYRLYVAQKQDPAIGSNHTRGDEALHLITTRVWLEDMRVDDAKKLWHQLKREHVAVAR